MPSILERIVTQKRREIAAARERLPAAELDRQLVAAPPVRNFLEALQRPGMQIIAEVKRASPSAGEISPHANVVEVAQTYARHGAACISVLTDAEFFHGQLNDLRAVHAAVPVPVLRKDFILDRYQVLEARVAGADAVLLIAEILDDEQLHVLQRDVESYGMAALVECYEPANLERVIASGARL